MWNICDGAIWSIRWEGVTSFRNNPLKPADLLEAARRPGIIHYWGHPKPWHPNSIRQDYGLFYKYWKKSPWKDDIRDFRKQNDPGRMFISKMRCLLGKGKRLLQGKHQYKYGGGLYIFLMPSLFTAPPFMGKCQSRLFFNKPT